MLLEGFRDGHFPEDWAAIKAFFETLKRFEPDLVLTHWGQDLHQDHRVASELAWNTFRDHLILEYEIPNGTAASARRTCSSRPRSPTPTPRSRS